MQCKQWEGFGVMSNASREGKWEGVGEMQCKQWEGFGVMSNASREGKWEEFGVIM